jgi:hypothetical protein
MKTNDRVREIIVKWYRALPFNESYDADFYRALDEIYIDEAWNVDDYDVKCEDGLKNLLAYLYFLEDMKARYGALGIDDSVFMDSAEDIVRWCDAWTETKGTLYLGELNWLSLVFSGKIIKLGRLQFCFAKEAHTIEKYGIEKGDTVLAIHIPAAGPLLLDECKKSVDMAREFFPKHFPNVDFKCFTCHSWLLDPTHAEIMKHGSNILAFQTMFDIVDKDVSESLFGYVFRWKMTRTELEGAECKSSFAKTVREKALEGRKFYAGLGVIEK